MKRILVIEDDSSVRAGLVLALRRNGFEVFDAPQAATGLEIAFSEQPDLVLSDVNLPGRNGFDVLKELRARTETAAIPVILMTGETHRADARHSMNLGADDFLAKPFTMDQMLATLRARLERQDGIQRALDAQAQAERISAAEKIRLQTTALEAAANGIAITDGNGKILWVNHAFARLTGYTAEEVVGKNPRLLNSGRHPRAFFAELWNTVKAGQVWRGELVNKRKDGHLYHEEMVITPVRGEDGEVQNFIAVKQDVSERKRAERERQMMELQLRQSQKLESIGQLAAGIAHEINTPTQYVGDNTRFVKDSFGAVAKVLDAYVTLLAAAKAQQITPELIARSEELLLVSDLEYLRAQIPLALNETLEGVERVTKIVRAMKEFSHPGGKEKIPADLNKAIESTVTVARNEWKYVADLNLDLDPALPYVPCFLGEFNQAMLNLIVNSAQAIGDVVKDKLGAKGMITVRSRRVDDCVEIQVTDTGTGIPEAARPKIFEPFFTTKEVGKGTGQGLAMVYASIVKRHGGTVTFETEVGRGTSFIIQLPLKAQMEAEVPAQWSREKLAA